MKLNIVPANRGLHWVKLGIQTFLKQPLALAGLFFMYIAAVVVVSVIPLLGVFIGGVLVPAATLGLMAASAEASTGKFPMPAILLTAFRAGRQRARAMLVLGVIYTVGSLIASGLAGLISGPADPAPRPGEMDPRTLLALAFHAPLFLLFWHAPALVHWHGVSPGKSLFFSAVACLRNLGAHLIYGFAWLAVFLGIGSAIGLVGLLLGGGHVARALLMPTALLLAAMFSASIYFTFRDSFSSSGEETPAEPKQLS